MAKQPWKSAADLWDKLKPRARRLRRKPTLAEARLWSRLRGNLVDGAHCRRQHVVGPAIADFYCGSAKLIVEVDGPIHERQAFEDRLRQEWLESNGFRVLRFTNEQVLTNLDNVIAEIAKTVRQGPPPRHSHTPH